MNTRKSNPIDTLILRGLEAAGQAGVSGEILAGRAGISRVAVWKRVKALEREGFIFDRKPGRGTILTGSPGALHPDLILSRLPPGTYAGIEISEETGSTNADADMALAAGRETPLAVLTRRQRQGRGRLGKVWEGESDANLYLSAAFRPFVHPRRLSWLTVATGLELASALGIHTGLSLALKWPNDLWVGDRKAAGILTESKVEGETVTGLVVGIGLNVNGPPFAPPLDQTATTLAAEAGRPFSLNTVAVLCLRTMHRVLEGLVETGPDRDHLADLWEAHDCLTGRMIEASGQTGTCLGLDDEASLLLRTGEGAIRALRSGEVSVRPV